MAEAASPGVSAARRPPRLAAPFLLLAMVDGGAFGAWVAGGPFGPGLAVSLAVHAGVSLAAGGLFALAVGRRSTSRAAVVTAASSASILAFFLPVFGGIGTWVALGLGRPLEAAPVAERRLRLPVTIDWDDPALKPTPPRRRAPADSLADELGGHAPERAERRLQAMLRVRRLPPRLQAPLARLALADPAEDVRLLAFSLIERLRGEHEAALRIWTARRAQATTRVERGKAHLRLAEIQWEMAYHGLCEGAVLEHTLEQALAQTDEALAAAPSSLAAAEAPIHMLRGRILLRLDRFPAAEVAFRRALGSGQEPAKVLPYLAECAFRLRHFPALRWYLTRLRSVGGSLGPFGPVMEHWL
jgi:hypothetical protein